MRRRKSSGDNRVAEAYEAGRLVPVESSLAERKKLRDAARATLIKDRRVNIRLSSPLLSDLQARAAEEGMPYQTLIASVLHKYVTGRLVERPSRLSASAGSRR